MIENLVLWAMRLLARYRQFVVDVAEYFDFFEVSGVRCQVSAQPPAKTTTFLIKKETDTV